VCTLGVLPVKGVTEGVFPERKFPVEDSMNAQLTVDTQTSVVLKGHDRN
jgi:hypothetical protein